ncbi:hypothetical protein Celaphus_00005513 [Cervus elaphus hippelaphus]|uniref:Uncharacterized protein n=1 Tax=Cervus elaphus hippelaphus TaxID=46360 RepID=A0A212CWL5_CEREH|nr:hypothetical protein Celaphus_00005513 [Cervus elaphus hippelaphus]
MTRARGLGNCSSWLGLWRRGGGAGDGATRGPSRTRRRGAPGRYAMAVMNHHVCPVENWYGALCRQPHSKAPFISVPSWAGAASSQMETLGLTALL